MILQLDLRLLIKKEPKYKQRNEVARENFIKKIASIHREDLVYIDELGVANNITTLYGWAVKGERSYAEQLGFASYRRNIVAGYNLGSKEIIAPFEYEGSTTKSLFTSWFEQILSPNLKSKQIVILDNASFHKDEELYDIVARYDCQLIYLPPYSPDLNPIEKFWANFKRNLRKVIKQFDDFLDAITFAMQITWYFVMKMAL